MHMKLKKLPNLVSLYAFPELYIYHTKESCLVPEEYVTVQLLQEWCLYEPVVVMAHSIYWKTRLDGYLTKKMGFVALL